MTDASTNLKPSSFTNAEAVARLKKRQRAESRFRAYGMIAIGVAFSFLALLLVSVVSQAISAFSHHKITFELTLDEAIVAPEGLDDREAIAENVFGFYKLVREDLARTFPEAEGSYRLTTQLNGLVTRLAVLPMARSTADHPARIGQTVKYTTALSDDLDLYLEGKVSGEEHLRLGQVTSTSGEAGRFSILPQSSLAELGEALQKASEKQAGEVGFEGSVLIRSGENVARLVSNDTTNPRFELLTGRMTGFDATRPQARFIASAEAERNVTDQQIAWTLALDAKGRLNRGFNWALLTNSDSTYPEIAGVVAAVVGSMLTMLVTSLIAVPIGIAAAIYLEEFAPKNRLTDLIEVNINNLAAVPSIVFGLLGAAVFLNLFGLPRSAPLVGGLVLGLLTLPTVIIASRAAMQAVPPSIRSAALGVGASQTQAVFHHVVPLAAPGILTGAIIGMARALGETAPLLLIGMVAFVAEVPSGPTDEATALPVLIYKWSTGAERAWEPNTAAAIVVLLIFMVLMNAIAVLLRRRLERRW